MRKLRNLYGDSKMNLKDVSALSKKEGVTIIIMVKGDLAAFARVNNVDLKKGFQPDLASCLLNTLREKL